MSNSWPKILANFVAIPLFIILAFYYRPFIPVFETPDEPSHFSVVKYIADSGQLPEFPNQFREGPVPLIEPGVPEYYAPPFYYALMSLFIMDLETDAFFEQLFPNPDFERQRGLNFIDNYSSKNMYVHTAVNQPNATWVQAFGRIRLFSIFWGAMTVWAAVLIGKTLWPKGFWFLLPALLIVFNSSFLYLSNGVSNDPLLIALSSWLIYLAIFLSSRDITPRDFRLIIFVFLISFAFLTKQTAVIFAPMLLLVILEQDTWTRRQKWRSIAISGLVIGLVGGSWYWFNIIQTGDLVALSSHRFLPEMTFSERAQFFIQQFQGTFKSYWASYGWATIFVENGWYLFFGLLTGFGFLGWGLPTTQPWARKNRYLIWGLILLNGLLMGYWLWRTAAPYGRLLYPTMIPFYCILVEGWRRFVEKMPAGWLQKCLITMIFLPLILLAGLAPTRYIQPAFASPVDGPISSESYQPANILFGNAVQLVGYDWSDESYETGDSIQITLYWQTSSFLQQNQLLNVQTSLLNIEEKVSTIEHWLGSARYPTAFWQPNTIVRQEIIIQTDETAVAPALYWFNLSVRNPQTNQPLAVTVDGILQDADVGRIGPIRIQPANAVTNSPVNEVNYTFSDSIQLYGFDSEWIDDQSGLQIQLYWESLVSLGSDQTIFVHLIGSNQEILTQSDKRPINGNYPTNWWLPGDALIDTHYLQLPQGEDLTGATLAIGMYDANGRLSIIDEVGAELPNRVITLPVEPFMAEAKP